MSFNLGYTFLFGSTKTNKIIYEIIDINTTSNYYKCTQIIKNENKINNDFPLQIYLNSNQLSNVSQYILPKYSIGTTFTMNKSNPIYSINFICIEYSYYKCINIENSSDIIYLSFSQLNNKFVSIISEEEEEEKNDIENRTTTFTLAEEDENGSQINLNDLNKILPYFTDWLNRKETSVLNQNDFKDDPSGYLKAIRNKYNIKHPREFVTELHGNAHDLRPWIEGKMEKLMAETGFLGTEKWKIRLFRLFDEALVWFDDEPSFFSKIIMKNKQEYEYMTPFGILPLAMITGLKTADLINMDENNVTITEEELLRLELQIGDEGVIILKCCDTNQRIKWYECLHSAIFTVQRPLFIKDKDLWRIAEPKPSTNSSKNKFGKNTSTKFKRQITKEDVIGNDRKRRKGMHVRMGQSIAFKVNELTSTWGTQSNSNSVSNDSIELPDIDNNYTSESNTLKNQDSNSTKVL